jgi:hypothetical protein
MSKRLLALVCVALASCSLSVEDAQLIVRPDLSSSANFLISRPWNASAADNDKAEAIAKEWAHKVTSCGGSYRQVFRTSTKLMVEAHFEMNDDRARKLLPLCLSDDADKPKIHLSRADGWFSDRYVLDVSWRVPFAIDILGKVDLLPASLTIQMPGSIETYVDRSYLPFARASWSRPRRDQLTMVTRALTVDEAKAQLRQSGAGNPASAGSAKGMDSRVTIHVVSKTVRWGALEWATLIGGIAALASLLAIARRLAKRAMASRTRSRRAAATPSPAA